MSLVAYGNSDSEAEEESTETVIKKTPLNLPLPKNLDLTSKVIKDGKGVKIGVPSLADFDSDDDEPSKKKQKLIPAGKSGLFARLPAPKNTTTQNSLIPQSISRKANQVKPVKKTELSDDEDDKEKGPLRFFFTEDEALPLQSVHNLSRQTNPYFIPDPSNEPYATQVDAEELAALEQEAIQIQKEEAEEAARRPAIDPDPEADPEDDIPTYRHREEEKPFEMNQQLLEKMQGRKQRGKEEINFIDVSVEQEMPKGNELKQLTEDAGYHSNKEKGPAPTAQQRRKHQITYLAFQAQERELELKNQWAQNKMTRKQTQSKYGF